MSEQPQPLIAERYELKRRLAQGGMAEVWLAVDLTLDRKVAVKWLKPLLASDEVVAERFRREAIAAASLNHPNIVAVHDVFEYEGRQAVVMQLVDGKSLRQLLDTQKRLSPELTGHIGACTAAALHHAHENNFVHRDVKPGNIMITPDGRVLLTDFGIAKALAGGDDLTSENIMMGTAKYLSPEQVRGKKLDGRADLYSLGLVLYECLAGRVPFLGETDADTALARLQRDPTDLTRLRPTLPTSLVTIIHQLLARNPMHRPATGAALVAALESAAAEGPPAIDDTPYEHSQVAPYSAGRLRRAPSDVDGRSEDRRRATRNNSPVDGTQRDSTSSRGRWTGRTPVVDARQAATVPVNSAPTGQTPAQTTDQTTDQTTGQTPAQTTGQRNVPGPRRIPGEPERITGAVPVQAGPAPAAVPPARPPHNTTPSAGAPLRGQPQRGMSQTTKPSLTVLGGLLLLAAIVAITLLISVKYGSDGEGGAPSTVLPPGATNAIDANGDGVVDPGEQANGAPAVAAGSGAIATISAYDPDGDDGAENDGQAAQALSDGNDQTAWSTSCYSDEFMGGKKGVGLVVTTDGLAQSALSVDVINGPYIVEFFTSTADNVPTSFDGWDAQLGSVQSASTGGIVVSDVPPAPVRHLLILLEQIGSDPSCSDARPYRGSLGEIGLVG